MTGIIIKALSGFYYIDDGSAVYECRARGNFRKSGISPLVGDKAEFELSGGSGVVTAVLPRKNFLSRPPVANIDRLFIVSSFENPAPNEYIIDRLTAIAVYHGIEPIIVFNECDAGDFSCWESIYRAAGFRVFTVSAETGDGIDALKSEFSGGISVLTGNSGVGKSSILNRIFGNTALKTVRSAKSLAEAATPPAIQSCCACLAAVILPIHRAFPRLKRAATMNLRKGSFPVSPIYMNTAAAAALLPARTPAKRGAGLLRRLKTAKYKKAALNHTKRFLKS